MIRLQNTSDANTSIAIPCRFACLLLCALCPYRECNVQVSLCSFYFSFLHWKIITGSSFFLWKKWFCHYTLCTPDEWTLFLSLLFGWFLILWELLLFPFFPYTKRHPSWYSVAIYREIQSFIYPLHRLLRFFTYWRKCLSLSNWITLCLHYNRTMQSTKMVKCTSYFYN